MSITNSTNSKSLFLYSILAVQLAIGGIIVQPAEALPFKKNCAALQAFLNAQTNWGSSPRPKFEGFEKQEIMIREDWARCPGGYITTTTPMGTKVCTGYITYFLDGSFSWGAIEKFPSNTACRYK
jgi:hypothetical protein